MSCTELPEGIAPSPASRGRTSNVSTSPA
jgi:hypothetical protein